MNNIKQIFKRMISGMSDAVIRFPLTIVSLIGSASLICYEIYKSGIPGLVAEKLIAMFIVAAVLGMSAQFAWERFEKLRSLRLVLYGVSALLAGGYLMIIWPAPEITAEIGIRTAVAVFALICSVLFIPTMAKAHEAVDFNQVALIHFKSAFTSILFSGVMSAGLAAIIATINILLFKVNTNTYGYMFTIVWVLFATIYYLSLLPNFNIENEEENLKLNKAKSYPKFLEILVSYIAIPLITAYTLVLIAYFIKILVTMNWPNGQVGVMVLIYSAVGMVVFVLCSLLENRFAKFYQMVFPKVLIPIVLMQFVSVFIRITAYGITESRYYVVLFGIFSLIVAVILSIWPVKRNKFIALVAAILAILSILPPIDAFTVSRNSQISRVEVILQAQGILTDQKLTAKANVDEVTKTEVTSILQYLENRSSLKYVAWLPKDFKTYNDMEKVIGFAPTYNNVNPDGAKYIYLNIDNQKPIVITGFDLYTNLYSGRFDKTSPNMNITMGNKKYVLEINRINNNDSKVMLKDEKGVILNTISLYEKAKGLIDKSTASKDMISPADMTFESDQNGYKLRIIFQNINGTLSSGTDAGFDYGFIVMIAVPK